MGTFIAAVEGKGGPGVEAATPPEPPALPDFSQMPPEMMEMMGRMSANLEFFFAHQLRTVTRYEPDFDTLAHGGVRIVVAGGAGSKGQPANNAAAAAADRLGVEMVEFPGDHQGFSTHPAEFAETLHRVLRAG
jgi:hypothetical protein